MSLQDKLFSTWINSHWHGDVEGFLLYWNGLITKIEETPCQTAQYLGDEEAFAPFCCE